MKTEETLLPWRRTGIVRSYNRDELTLDVSSASEPNVFVLRKLRPNEPKPGFYAAFHNGERISEAVHEFMRDAKAEAEAYFYALPQFAKSGNGKILEAVRETGRADFEADVTLQQGFATYDGANREAWLRGWLDAYQARIITRLSASIEATTRANNQLENDLQFERSRMMALTLVFEFAISQSSPERGIDFLRAFVTKGRDTAAEEFPEWSAFFASRTTPPAPEPIT